MSETFPPILKLLQSDPRYKLDAYQFIREALAYAQDVLKFGNPGQRDAEDEEEELGESDIAPERHISGQQLCQAIRAFAQDQFGYMAKVVLNSWGIHTTSDFGAIVFNLIEIDCMKKSDSDRREDFDDQFDFDEAFTKQYEITRIE